HRGARALRQRAVVDLRAALSALVRMGMVAARPRAVHPAAADGARAGNARCRRTPEREQRLHRDPGAAMGGLAEIRLDPDRRGTDRLGARLDRDSLLAA